METHERLKHQRLIHNYTQKEIADYLGMSVGGYGFYEQGRREPSIEILKMLASKYGVSIDYFADNPELERQTILQIVDAISCGLVLNSKNEVMNEKERTRYVKVIEALIATE